PMMMARVRWVVPGGRAGACIALMWPQTGFAARKILVPVKPPTASSSRAAKTARDLAQDGTFPKCAALCETEGNIAERDSVGLWVAVFAARDDGRVCSSTSPVERYRRKICYNFPPKIMCGIVGYV